MSGVLVSFCNIATAGGCVAAHIDTESSVFQPLDYQRTDLTSACGLAQDDKHVYSACAVGNSSFLAIFEKPDLRLLEVLPLPGVVDVHSICLDGSALIAVSTGTDEIIRMPLADTARSEVLRRASESGEDTHHLNAVGWYGGRLFCSGFGLKSGERWKSAERGYIYDVSGAAFLMREIHHPHSPVEHAGTLYFCESSRSLLRTLSGVTMPLSGYTRGLAFLADGTCLVGTSVGRYDVSSPELVLNPADSGARVGRCAIEIRSPQQALASRSIDCSHLADEIYDILPL